MLLLLLYVGVSTLSGEIRLLLSLRGAWRQNNQRTRPPLSRAEVMKVWFNVVKTEKPPATRISQHEPLCCTSWSSSPFVSSVNVQVCYKSSIFKSSDKKRLQRCTSIRTNSDLSSRFTEALSVFYIQSVSELVQDALIHRDPLSQSGRCCSTLRAAAWTLGRVCSFVISEITKSALRLKKITSRVASARCWYHLVCERRDEMGVSWWTVWALFSSSCKSERPIKAAEKKNIRFLFNRLRFQTWCFSK